MNDGDPNSWRIEHQIPATKRKDGWSRVIHGIAWCSNCLICKELTEADLLGATGTIPEKVRPSLGKETQK